MLVGRFKGKNRTSDCLGGLPERYFKMGKLSKKILYRLQKQPLFTALSRALVAPNGNCLHKWTAMVGSPLAWLYGLTQTIPAADSRRKFCPHVRECGIVRKVVPDEDLKMPKF